MTVDTSIATGVVVRNPPRSPLAAFQEAAEAGSLVTGRQSFPPRFTDASGRLEIAAAAEGIVYSATRVERRGEPYTLALVDLAGGGRVLAQVLAEDAAALVGCAVRRLPDATPFLFFAVIPPQAGA